MVECQGCARFRWGTADVEVGGVVRRRRDTSREGVSNDLLFYVITAHTRYNDLISILRSPLDQRTQSLYRPLQDQSTENPPVTYCYVRQPTQGTHSTLRHLTCCSESGYPTVALAAQCLHRPQMSQEQEQEQDRWLGRESQSLACSTPY